MYLLLFESIGTQELILIGIVALIFLGPRKLPQIARTIGKTLADFRNTTNEFKSTWEREVNFEEEEKALRSGDLTEQAVPRQGSKTIDNKSLPKIKEIDSSAFESTENVAQNSEAAETDSSDKGEVSDGPETLSDKRSWL